ncbi:MAG: hypothetical protein ACOYEV_06805 [Candidatus Nanopelagicales bacterium]
MVWFIVIVVGIAALVVCGVVSLIAEILFAPGREASSPAQIAVLAGLGVAALIGSVAIGSGQPDAAFVPWVFWLVALSIIRHSAPLSETEPQRRAREAAERQQAEEDEKRAAARKVVAERKRVDSFTKDGLAVMEKAKAAVQAVTRTEAAREGWLGEPADFDFSADLAMISDTLLQARRIEKMVERAKKLPDPTRDDRAMVREAETSVRALRAEVKQRVKILDGCATQAREVDRLLAEERRQQKLDAQRDDARRQLAAELYGVEARATQRESDAADAVAARVAAFRELKNIVDEQVLLEVEQGSGGTDLISRARRLLPF